MCSATGGQAFDGSAGTTHQKIISRTCQRSGEDLVAKIIESVGFQFSYLELTAPHFLAVGQIEGEHPRLEGRPTSCRQQP